MKPLTDETNLNYQAGSDLRRGFFRSRGAINYRTVTSKGVSFRGKLAFDETGPKIIGAALVESCDGLNRSDAC